MWETEGSVLTYIGSAKEIKLIFLDIVSFKYEFGWETPNQSLGKDMTPKDELFMVP